MSAAVSVLLVILLVIVGALVIAAIWGVGIYNSLVGLRNTCKNAFAQVDVQLKRRYDLIPNLVEIAKGYMKHESSTLEAVIKARNAAYAASQTAAANPADAAAMKGLLGAEAGLALADRGGLAPVGWYLAACAIASLVAVWSLKSAPYAD